MHIPDGYLSPLISVGAAVVTVPAWGLATQRVKTVLNNQTIPLLAIVSALSFTIMMFNIPVSGWPTGLRFGRGSSRSLVLDITGLWAVDRPGRREFEAGPVPMTAALGSAICDSPHWVATDIEPALLFAAALAKLEPVLLR